ncbi:hypothetical protein Ciccas_012602, partial [Cichlidogyrus casuarinus]
WFPHKRGLVVGLIVSGFGAGSLIFSPIQYAFINPENKKVNNITRFFDDPDLLERIPYVFLLCGGIIVAMQIIGLLMLAQKPAQKHDEEITKPVEEAITMKEIFRDGRFYILWLLMLCHAIPLTLVATQFKVSIYLMLGLWCFGQICFPFLSKLSSVTAVKVLYAILVSLIFFSFSGSMVLMPTVCSRLFKPINMSIVYGFVFSAFSVGSIGCAVLSKYLVNQWYALFLSGAGINIVGAVLNTLLPDQDMNSKLNVCRPLTDRIWKEKKPDMDLQNKINVESELLSKDPDQETI